MSVRERLLEYLKICAKKKRVPFGTPNLCTHCAAGRADDLRNLLFELVV